MAALRPCCLLGAGNRGAAALGRELSVFPLIAGLSASNDQVAGNCAQVLGFIKDPRAFQPLIDGLSKRIAKVLLKHFDEAVGGRAVFIFIELLENDETKSLVYK